jgi:putative ABC transport system permease protein
MRTMALLVLARLRSHVGRSLVLILVVAAAACIALAGLAVLDVAEDPWAPLVAETYGGDVVLDEVARRPDPAALAALPGVEAVGDLLESGDAALRVGGEVILVSLRRMPDREAMVIDRPSVRTGDWFASGDEVVFEATLADVLGLHVGDEVTLSGEQARTVQLVGTAATTMMPNYPERIPGTIFAPDALYDAIAPVGEPGWSIGLRLADPSQAHAVATDINEGPLAPDENCTIDGGCARTGDNIRSNAFPDRIDGLATTMLFFAVLMLIAAVILIVTLLGSRLVSEARELTLLQVAGVTPARLALIFAAEHTVLAMAGVGAGTLVALVVAPRIAQSVATALGSVSTDLSLADIGGVGVTAVVLAATVSAIGGWRAARRSLALVARGSTGPVHKSRMAALAIAFSSRATLALGLKDVASRRGRATAVVLSVALAVMIAVAVVGLGTPQPDPELQISPTAELPADPSEISGLRGVPSVVSADGTDRIMNLVATLQVLLGGVAVLTLLAAAAMSMRERIRELGTLHALGCTTTQLVGASAISQGALGAIGAAIGVPLGLGLYSVLQDARGVVLEGGPPATALLLVALAAVATAATTAAIPALLIQRNPTSEALAAE